MTTKLVQDVNVTKEEGTKIVDIIEIDNILIDVDVKKDRKKNGVSIPTDKNLAYYVAKNIIKELEENINFRVSLFVDSGNGYHIFQKRIDIHSKNLKKRYRKFIDPRRVDT
jgi:hypothetical protein